jgi:putative protein-disulfide isomerase
VAQSIVPVEVLYFTDPACPWSWATEPSIRRLEWELGDRIRFRPVMGGLARTFEVADHPGRIAEWLQAADASGMPLDPLLWARAPLSSSYPACQAVKAAAEQGADAEATYLRRLREGIMLQGRKLDHAEPLVAAAGEARLDAERFEIDLRSHASVEAFGADLEQTRSNDLIRLPSLVFVGEDGAPHSVYGWSPYADYRQAAEAAGAEGGVERRAEPLQAIERFGPLATRELEELTGKPRPVLEAELWALAREWRLRPTTYLTGTIWERA